MKKTLNIFILILLLLCFSATAETYSLSTSRALTSTTYSGFNSQNVNSFFSVYFKNVANAGDAVLFTKDGVEIRLQPHSMNYQNALNQLQSIGMPNSNAGTPSGTTYTYPNVYGAGISLIYSIEADRVKETIKINSFANLPTATATTLNGGSPEIEINFVLATNAQRITIDGADWDKSTDRVTSNEVYIKDASGNVLYWFARPIAYDNAGHSVSGIYKFKKSSNKLYVSVRVPYSFLINPTTIYPIYIDPTFIVDYSPIPAEQLINGTVSVSNDNQFQNLTDITLGVSDNSTATNYETKSYSPDYSYYGNGMTIMNWKFDETSGTVIHDTALRVLATAYGSPDLSIAGTSNTGIRFDGINDYILIPNNRIEYNLSASEEIMVCLAIKTNGDLPNNKYIIDMKDGGLVGWELKGADDEIRLSTQRASSGNKNMETNFNFNDNNWHTYCGFSGFTNMTAYVDGNNDKVYSATQTGSMVTTEPFVIGVDNGLSASNYLGEDIDELCVIKGTNLQASVIASIYNQTKQCDGLFKDNTKGIGISGHWSVTYNPAYDWFLRLYKTTAGSTNITVAPYYNNQSININYSVTKIFDQIGWFNINVSSLMAYQQNVLGFNYTDLRFWTDTSHNFSEVVLRREINETTPPTIFSCQANATTIPCFGSVKLQCNATDNLDVDNVSFTINGTTYLT